MLKPENLKSYVDTTYEIPINPEVEPPQLQDLKTMDDFKVMKMPLNKVGTSWKDVRNLIEAAGLDLDI